MSVADATSEWAMIARTDDRVFWLLRQRTPGVPPSAPFDGRCFPCLLWDLAGGWSIDERHVLISALTEHGCRYFVCAGANSSAWEDAADEAHVIATLALSDAEREDRHVMTTSHPGETEDDVAFFFVFNTNFDDHAFTDFLVLVLGSDEAATQRLTEAVRAQALGSSKMV